MQVCLRMSDKNLHHWTGVVDITLCGGLAWLG